MKIIECNEYEFNQIKKGVQLYKVFDCNNTFEFLENCQLKNIGTNELINIQITSINKYNNINDVLKFINIEKFGKYTTIKEFKSFINKNYDLSNGFLVCRIKNLDEQFATIKDKNLLNLIDVKTLKKYTLGLSGCQVYNVMMRNHNPAILKIQTISGNDSLKEEYDILQFLNKKINVAVPYYYNFLDNNEYLLRECLEGQPLYKFKNFGLKLGKELKYIHSLYSNKIKFDKFSTDNLLKNALENIDIVYQTRSIKFKNYSKEELINFLKINKPMDDALIHGDFSLTNILVNDDVYYYIDLGNVSISTKYFDIYVLNKSLKINKLENEFNSFLKGYGLEDIEDVYMDWMSLIESSYN